MSKNITNTTEMEMYYSTVAAYVGFPNGGGGRRLENK